MQVSLFLSLAARILNLISCSNTKWLDTQRCQSAKLFNSQVWRIEKGIIHCQKVSCANVFHMIHRKEKYDSNELKIQVTEISLFFTPSNAHTQSQDMVLAFKKLYTELISHSKCKIQRIQRNSHTLLKLQHPFYLNKIHAQLWIVAVFKCENKKTQRKGK